MTDHAPAPQAADLRSPYRSAARDTTRDAPVERWGGLGGAVAVVVAGLAFLLASDRSSHEIAIVTFGMAAAVGIIGHDRAR